MYILGVNISHHPSIVLLEDGKIVFYLEDDRWNRIKEVEWDFTQPLKSILDIRKYTDHIDHIIYTSYGKPPWHPISDELTIDYVKKHLELYRITFDKEYFYHEHHLYHACSAFYGSEFEESAALVMDGGGWRICQYCEQSEVESMYYFASTGDVRTVKKVYGSRLIDLWYPKGHNSEPLLVSDNIVFSDTLSCGTIFNTSQYVTATNSPGKVMGISPYRGYEDDSEWFVYHEKTDTWVTDNESVLNSYRRFYNEPHLDPASDDPREFDFDIAASLSRKVQDETFKQTVRLIRQLMSKVDTKNLVLSGGYFLNCVNNYRYLKEFPDINFWIDPTSHDGGTAIGAAKYLWHHILKEKSRYPLETLYLG
jgi:carbamoyltransferase